MDGSDNANKDVVGFTWIDDFHIVVTLPNSGQRHTSWRLNVYMQHCLGRHLADASRC